MKKYEIITNSENRAKDLFKQGYNCAQAVLCAFCEQTEMDFDDALRIASSFGGGMGRLREVCGAVSGMFMVAGVLYGYNSAEDHKKKTEHYRLIQQLAKQFETENGHIVCGDLLGIGKKINSPVPDKRTKEYYKKRPCVELVGCAAKIVEELINNKNMEVKNVNSSSK